MISRLGPVVFVAICVMSTIAVPLPDDSQSSLLSETQVRLQFSKVPPRLLRLTTLPHSLHFSVSWENSSGYMARRAAFHPMIRQEYPPGLVPLSQTIKISIHWAYKRSTDRVVHSYMLSTRTNNVHFIWTVGYNTSYAKYDSSQGKSLLFVVNMGRPPGMHMCAGLP